jgi:hypothetical protein
MHHVHTISEGTTRKSVVGSFDCVLWSIAQSGDALHLRYEKRDRLEFQRGCAASVPGAAVLVDPPRPWQLARHLGFVGDRPAPSQAPEGIRRWPSARAPARPQEEGRDPFCSPRRGEHGATRLLRISRARAARLPRGRPP